MNRSLRTHEDELNHVLRDTVPGLVQGALETAVQTMLSQLGNEDRLLGADHHRLLIRPDAFHVSVLFQPTLMFLTRVADVLPSGLESTRASTELLDDFVLNVYLPQLEEKSSLLFHNIVTGHDAFLVDPASLKLSSQPLLKVRFCCFIYFLMLSRRIGMYATYGSSQFSLCHAQNNAFPSRQLFPTHSKCYHSILSTMQ